MSKGTINKVILIGRLGNDPELRYMPNGNAVANFSVATNQSWKDKEGNPVEKTEWHRVTAWRKLAEVCGQYLKKGSLVYVEGKLETRSYEDKDGNKKYTTSIVANQVQMLGSKQDTEKTEQKPKQAKKESKNPFDKPPEEPKSEEVEEGSKDNWPEGDEIPF